MFKVRLHKEFWATWIFSILVVMTSVWEILWITEGKRPKKLHPPGSSVIPNLALCIRFYKVTFISCLKSFKQVVVCLAVGSVVLFQFYIRAVVRHVNVNYLQSRVDLFLSPCNVIVTVSNLEIFDLLPTFCFAH